MLYNFEATLYFSKTSLLDAVLNNGLQRLRVTLSELNSGVRTEPDDFYVAEQLETGEFKLDLKLIFIDKPNAINFGDWVISLFPWAPYIEGVENTVIIQEFEDGVLGDIVYEQTHIVDEPIDVPVDSLAWKQPTHAGNAYSVGDKVTHKGKIWESLISGNVWAPGISGWKQVVDESSGEVADWVQPTGAHDAYELGAIVMHNDKKWQSTVNDNVWEPGVFGWQEIE